MSLYPLAVVMNTQSRGNIRFVAVGRSADRVIVASHCAWTQGAPAAKIQSVCQKVLSSDKVGEYSRLTITDREVGTVHYDSDESCVYMAVTATDYPQRHIFKLLEEVKKDFLSNHRAQLSTAGENALAKAAKRWMGSLCSKYDNLESIDKVRGVMAQVDEVKGVMHENVNKMLENHAKLEDLDDKAEELRNEAGTFKKGATKLKNRMWWQNCKLTLIIFILFLVVIAIIVGIICGSMGKCSKK